MRGRYTIKLRQNHGFIGGFKPFTTVTVTVGHMPNLLEMEVFFYDKLSSNVPGVWLKHAIVFLHEMIHLRSFPIVNFVRFCQVSVPVWVPEIQIFRNISSTVKHIAEHVPTCRRKIGTRGPMIIPESPCQILKNLGVTWDLKGGYGLSVCP